MKISIIGTHGIPARYGGFETCAQEIGSRLAKRGHDVTVYSKTLDPESAPREYLGVKLVQLPRFRNQPIDYALHGFLTTLMSAVSDADVLHFFGCDHVPFSLAGRLARKGVVLTVDGLEWERMGYPFAYRAYLRSFAELATTFPHVTVADSPTSRKWYFDRTGIQPRYIPYGTNISSGWDPHVLEKFNLQPKGYILFVGRLVYEKGVHTLVEAFKSVNTNLKLAIVGDALKSGDYVQTLKEKADERTVFLGYVHGPDFESIRNAAFVYVHPSLLEGTSISLLGALGAGLGIIASDLPENIQVGGDSVLYFEKAQVSSLVEKLRQVVDKPGLVDEFAKRALERSRRLYDWDKVTEMYEAAYSDSLRFRKIPKSVTHT